MIGRMLNCLLQRISVFTMNTSTILRLMVTVGVITIVNAQYSRESRLKKYGKLEKPQKPESLRTDTTLPNLSAPTNIISMDNHTFIQDFSTSTYYIRQGDKLYDGPEASRPRTLFPQGYGGVAEFYAFYVPRFSRTYYINYVSGARGSVAGYHVFDDVLEPFQPVSMVQKMLEMMRDTPFFN
ncbi:unnamed protein product [Bursaphelenchus okinawaensis]|uniref:Uncharacterized protein n=1 Tax=Bursaphelenchus okinawaensis TaxID=465554 RepID=A0A811JWV3_9BILA|nr:unnamed protein product [Bursaphelenchus okinawaensis]CAG9086226.1 unnamed protein product [Bursaphelenchus okinawaensis]